MTALKKRDWREGRWKATTVTSLLSNVSCFGDTVIHDVNVTHRKKKKQHGDKLAIWKESISSRQPADSWFIQGVRLCYSKEKMTARGTFQSTATFPIRDLLVNWSVNYMWGERSWRESHRSDSAIDCLSPESLSQPSKDVFRFLQKHDSVYQSHVTVGCNHSHSACVPRPTSYVSREIISRESKRWIPHQKV